MISLLVEAVEPTTFDNWVEVISDFASLKNFILSAGGLTLISVLLKLRGAYKFIKTPKGQDRLYEVFENWLGKLVENPKLITGLIQTLSTLPVVQAFTKKVENKLNQYDLELQERILNLQAKIDNDVFKSAQDKQAAILLIDELRAKLSGIDENTQSSE